MFLVLQVFEALSLKTQKVCVITTVFYGVLGFGF